MLEVRKRHEERLARLQNRQTQTVEDDFVIDKGTTLKKDDLKKYQYLNPIREYMIERKGVDYQDASDDEVIEDFVDHMRYFNANTVSTAGEVRFVTKADEERKAKARKAYEIYDQLGNVFVNDGVMGAVDGVKDYVFAAVKDPTNYLGLLTGGVGRIGAAGVSLTGKQTVRAAVRAAGREALKDGANKKAAQEAAKRAGKQAAKRAIENGATKRQADGVFNKVAEKVSKDGHRSLAQNAMRKAQAKMFENAGIPILEKIGLKGALKQTIALDAGFAVLQDVMAQETLLRVDAQKEYNYLQTGFSSLLGGVAGGAQLAAGKFRGASGFEDTTDPLERVSNNIIEEYTPIFNKKETKEAADLILEEAKSWNEKVAKGQQDFSNLTLPASLLKNIMLGKDSKSGLAKLFKDKGFKLARDKTVSDVITNVARFIPQRQLNQINKEMSKHTGIKLGDLTQDGTELGNLIAKDISSAGQVLNVMSQVRKVLDGTIVASSDKLAATFDEIETKEVLARELKKANKAEPFKYGQSVWKRLLVSSPATTAVNVAGFTQFYVGQSLADLFNFTMLGIKGLGQMAIDPAAARESFRRAGVLTKIQGQKIRNLMDPYTTHDTYLEFLNSNQDVKKTLFETMAGGVEATADRYNINPDNKLFQNIESFTTAASQITGVRIQDSFTKSQMFMTELDKYLRLDKGITLKEALLMDENVIDEVVLGGALDGTLKSVFAKDYTSKEQNELIRMAAKFTETISNTPMLGTILPFGRFFNNVLATAYQWSPLAAPGIFKNFVRNIAKNEGTDFTEQEAFARMAVGSAGLFLASEYDTERREKGLGVYDVDVGGGTIVDAKNSFPFSMFLAAGRIFNMKRNGEDVPDELIQELGTQLAVGQLARDAQFGNDLNNLIDVMLNSEEGARGASADAFYKVGGNFLAGFTRPVDALNKTVGFAMGTDGAKDVRQADGANVFTQSATKYVDNILEAFIDAADAVTEKDLTVGDKSITGEDLKVATREGDVYDPNPFARIFGLTIKPGRTATEKAYSMAEMQPWTANERTKIPAYDKTFNAFIAPILEYHTQKLISSPQFKEASLTGKRKMLKLVLSDVKKYTRDKMSKGYAGNEGVKLRAANLASRAGTKEIRREAMQLMKERYGTSGSIEDLNYRELDIFMQYVEHLEDIYEAAAEI